MSIKAEEIYFKRTSSYFFIRVGIVPMEDEIALEEMEYTSEEKRAAFVKVKAVKLF